LAESLVYEERKTVTAGATPMALTRGLGQGVEAVGTERTTCSHRPQGNKDSPRERRSRSTWCRSEQVF
jgi:hypothetical protein